MKIQRTVTVTVTPEGEKAIGLAFLQGSRLRDIATFHCLHIDTVEAVIRASMQHLIAIKRAVGESQEIFDPVPSDNLTAEPK